MSMLHPISDAIVNRYESPMAQHWTQNQYARTFTDQYGFEIRYGSEHTLSHRGIELITVKSLAAARMISTIYLNDVILNSK